MLVQSHTDDLLEVFEHYLHLIRPSFSCTLMPHCLISRLNQVALQGGLGQKIPRLGQNQYTSRWTYQYAFIRRTTQTEEGLIFYAVLTASYYVISKLYHTCTYSVQYCTVQYSIVQYTLYTINQRRWRCQRKRTHSNIAKAYYYFPIVPINAYPCALSGVQQIK